MRPPTWSILAACCLLALVPALLRRDLVARPVAHWMAAQVATPEGTPAGESTVVLAQGQGWCGLDSSGATLCVLLLSPGRYHLFPAMLENAATDTPIPSPTPWPGTAAMPTAGEAPGDYGQTSTCQYGGCGPPH